VRYLLIAFTLLVFLNAQMSRENDTVFDTETNLQWQDDIYAKKVMKSFKMAQKECEELTFAGYDDWRLPDIRELKSIADTSGRNPAIKKGFKNTASSFYWSSTEHADNPERAWFVSFDNGFKYSYHKNRSYYVRCVRSFNYQ